MMAFSSSVMRRSRSVARFSAESFGFRYGALVGGVAFWAKMPASGKKIVVKRRAINEPKRWLRDVARQGVMGMLEAENDRNHVCYWCVGNLAAHCSAEVSVPFFNADNNPTFLVRLPHSFLWILWGNKWVTLFYAQLRISESRSCSAEFLDFAGAVAKNPCPPRTIANCGLRECCRAAQHT